MAARQVTITTAAGSNAPHPVFLVGTGVLDGPSMPPPQDSSTGFAPSQCRLLIGPVTALAVHRTAIHYRDCASLTLVQREVPRRGGGIACRTDFTNMDICSSVYNPPEIESMILFRPPLHKGALVRCKPQGAGFPSLTPCGLHRTKTPLCKGGRNRITDSISGGL